MAKLTEKQSPTRLSSTTFTDLLFYDLKVGKYNFVIEVILSYESTNDNPRTITNIHLRIRSNNVDHRETWFNNCGTHEKHSFSYVLGLFLSDSIALYPTTKEKIVHDLFSRILRHCHTYMSLDLQFHTLQDITHVKQWEKEFEALKAKYKKENLAKAKREK